MQACDADAIPFYYLSENGRWYEFYGYTVPAGIVVCRMVYPPPQLVIRLITPLRIALWRARSYISRVLRATKKEPT